MLGAKATGAGRHEARDFCSPGCDGGTFRNQSLLEDSMPNPHLFRVSAEPLDDAILVSATGEIDMSTVDVLQRELTTAREEGSTVLLDLSGVTFIDSTGLHLLLEASHSSGISDGGFFVVRPSRVVQRLIELSGTADLIMVVDPRAERVLG
jgi:anti-sigma B factor antagonist